MSSAHNVYSRANQTHFARELGFDTEVQGILEMAYFFLESWIELEQ